MQKHSLFLALLLPFLPLFITAQNSISVTRLDGEPVIDGVADEAFWNGAATVSGFTTTLPQFAQTPQSPTTVRMGFTDQALFITAICTSNVLRNDGSVRDDKGTGEYFSVGLDTWNDDQNAFVFTVTAQGQRIDQRVSSTQIETGFDTPWEARTTLQADGWTVEMKIPFRSVRYPVKGPQNWGIQFTRFDRSTGETSTWNPQNPLIQDIVLQYGASSGLEIGRQRDRLGLTSISNSKVLLNGRQEFVRSIPTFKYRDANQVIETSLDGRWGPNSATTIDFSILPPLLVFDKDNGYGIPEYNNYQPDLPGPRPLLAEESGLTNKTAGLRHVNGYRGENLAIFVPTGPFSLFNTYGGRSINNIKMTTRTANNIGIGVANTISNESDISYFNPAVGSFSISSQDLPVTNQIFVEKAFRNNSWIQVSNSHDFVNKNLHYNQAEAAGQWRDKSNQLEISGKIGLETISNHPSKVYGNGAIEKINGQWNYGLEYVSPGQPITITPFYYFFRNLPEWQRHNARAFIGKRNYQPGYKKWLNASYGMELNLNHDKEASGEKELRVGAFIATQNQRFSRTHLVVGYTPVNRDQKFDFSENTISRKLAPTADLSVSWSSDERKRLTYSGLGSITKSMGNLEDQYTATVGIQWVPSKRWTLNGRYYYDLNTNRQQRIFDQTTPLGITINDAEYRLASANILFSLSRKWNAGAGLQHYNFREKNQTAYNLDPETLELQPNNTYVFPKNGTNYTLQPSFFITWNMSPIRQISLSYNEFFQNVNYTHPYSANVWSGTFALKAVISLYN